MSSITPVSPNEIVGWYDLIRDIFKDFKPETRSMEINFAQLTTRMHVQITVPDGPKRKFAKIRIPAYHGYRISGMIDEAFVEHSRLWRLDGDSYVLKAGELPPSTKYRVTLVGTISRKMLNDLVYVKPAANQDNDEANDKYWLESSLKNPELLRQTYADLEIDDVSSGVVVDIDKMFGLAVPKEVQDTASAVKRLLEASKTFDRNKILRAAVSYKKSERSAPIIAVNDFHAIVDKVTGRDTILRHLKIDPHYNIGRVDQPVKYSGIIPQELSVQALTRLSLRTPRVSGYLTFNRKDYIDLLTSEFKKISKKSRVADKRSRI